MENIDSFYGQYAFLSNFYPCEVEFEGDTYPSAEHAYQAAKTIDPDVRRITRGLSSPGKQREPAKILEFVLIGINSVLIICTKFWWQNLIPLNFERNFLVQEIQS
jgi:hypothetical protein